MQFVPTQQKLTPQQRRLLDLFSVLDDQNRSSLLAFAEFLAERATSDDIELSQDSTPIEAKLIPRPAKESVVKAIQRLSASYHMVQREKMLDETSSLMMSHVIHGRDAASVIDDLEKLFEAYYLQYLRDD